MTARFLLFLFLVFSQAVSAQSFVQVQEGRFVLNGQPYYYIGTNYWYGSLLAQGANRKVNGARLRYELNFLAQQGVTNLRLLGGAEGEGLINGMPRVGPPLQPEQGRFNDSVLDGLDLVLAEMGKRKMKAVIMLSNNWEWSGGFLQYLNWNGLLPDSILRRKLSWDEMRDYGSRFYGCAPCVEAYRKQVAHLLERRNKITGIAYADDPAIMAWELANEPRPMRPAANEAYSRWVADLASFIKSRAPKQLVTLGHEGYIGTESPALYESIHRDKNVDYLTIHIWPKNWGWFRKDSMEADFGAVLQKTGAYIDHHVAQAEALRKPLVVEEFGMPRDRHLFSPRDSTQLRDQYFRFIFERWRNSQREASVLCGVNFWAFGGSARAAQLFWKPGDAYMGDPPMEEQGLNTVFDSDRSTWLLIEGYTGRKKPLRKQAPRAWRN